MTRLLRMKIQQIARWRVAGVRAEIICDMLNLTQSGLSRIIALPEYRDVEDAILNGTVSKMDEVLAGRAEVMRHEFAPAVPMAMRTLVEICAQRRDLRSALAAARELLARDPERTFPSESHQASLGPNAPTLPSEMFSSVAADADKVAEKVSKPN